MQLCCHQHPRFGGTYAVSRASAATLWRGSIAVHLTTARIHIDWAVIQQRFDSLGYGSALRSYAVLANAYFGYQVPPALSVSGWARLRRRFYRTELEHPAMHFLFSLGRLLRIGARNLGRNPRSMKKLFGARYYIRLY